MDAEAPGKETQENKYLELLETEERDSAAFALRGGHGEGSWLKQGFPVLCCPVHVTHSEQHSEHLGCRAGLGGPTLCFFCVSLCCP